MKLKQIDIENFRSIKSCTIKLNEITAIVGENNSGKTAILKAINSFFNFEEEEADFDNAVHRYAPSTITRIRLTFSDLPDKPLYNRANETGDDYNVLFMYSYSKTKKGRKLFCEYSNTEKVPLDVSAINDIKQDIDYVYIPTNRGSQDLEWNEDSVFSKLVKRYLEDYTKNRDTLSHNAIASGSRIRDQVLKKLSRELSSLNMFDDIGKYKIDFKQTLDYTIFLDKLGLEISDNNLSFSVSQYGSGVKSLTVVALYRMLANLNNNSIILGLEEPETNLHPQAQRLLIDSIKNSRQSSETQAIFTTHSPVIVDALNHDDVVLVRRIADEKRGYHTETRQLAKSFWEDHGISDLKHYNFFHSKNSEFFFARYVIITESITDAQVIQSMLKPELEKEMYYVSIVSLGGVENIQYPFFLLQDLGIPFSAVVDKDFFALYKNGSLAKSRNRINYLPEYKDCIRRDKRVINSLFKTESEKEVLKSKFNSSHTMFFDFIKKYNLLPMKYCLEMDLIECSKARELYYDHYQLKDEERTMKALLVDRKDSIKDPTVLVPIFKQLSPAERPNSYKKIRSELVKRIKNINA